MKILYFGLLASLTMLAAGQLQARPFTFVALPDTQVYAENRLPDGRTPAVTDPRGTGAIFFDQTDWIVANADASPRSCRRGGRRWARWWWPRRRGLGIQYVSHLGDIVQRGEVIEEWELAKAAMDPLRKIGLPHGTVMGNHDDIPPRFLEHGQTYQSNYLEYFGPQEFERCRWYRGASPSGAANYQVLWHRGFKLLFLNFSIDHPQAEIEWARKVARRHPNALIIVGTHRYLYDFKLFAGRYGEPVSTPFGPLTITDNPVPGAEEPNTGQELFEEFVTEFPNILMIHAGHFHSEWLRLDGVNGGGHPVIQILTDYQSTRNGGDGWLRVYQLDFKRKEFRFHSYSPTLKRKRSTIDHFVETIYLAWENRSDVKPLIGIDPADPNSDLIYLGFIEQELKRVEGLPNFLATHPDLDEPEEQAYFARYLDELFLGAIPPGFEDVTQFQKLWLAAFAADPGNPLDFSDGPRSPSGLLSVDYRAYLGKWGEKKGYKKKD